jgi:hypothetical protein
MIDPLSIALIAGAGLAYMAYKSPAGSTSNLTAAQLSATSSANQIALQATANAQAWNAQAQALGLTQAQADEAYATGLTPQEYYNGFILGQAAAQPQVSGWGPPANLLELFDTGHVDATTGAQIMVDAYGNPWLNAA